MARFIGVPAAALRRHSSAKVWLDTDQTISHNTITKVQIDTTDDDHNAHVDGLNWDVTNHQFEIEDPGIYWTSGTVKWDSDSTTSGWSTGDRCLARIHKNGSQIVNAEIPKTGTGLQSNSSSGVAIPLDKGDTISLHVYQNSGSGKIVKRSKGWTFLSLIQLGKLSKQ